MKVTSAAYIVGVDYFPVKYKNIHYAWNWAFTRVQFCGEIAAHHKTVLMCKGKRNIAKENILMLFPSNAFHCHIQYISVKGHKCIYKLNIYHME